MGEVRSLELGNGSLDFLPVALNRRLGREPFPPMHLTHKSRVREPHVSFAATSEHSL